MSLFAQCSQPIKRIYDNPNHKKSSRFKDEYPDYNHRQEAFIASGSTYCTHITDEDM
eukprot:gene1566-2830_t